jgi:hypothetical protein
MKITLFRTSAAVAVVFSFAMTGLVHAEEPAGAGQAPVEQSAGAPQNVRANAVTPEGRQQQPATVERQQVAMGDGQTVTVLRPVVTKGGTAVGVEEDVRPEMPPVWQVAAGWRLWLINPAAKELRTCAVRNTSTVGVEAIRCLSVSASGFRRTFGPIFAP